MYRLILNRKKNVYISVPLKLSPSLSRTWSLLCWQRTHTHTHKQTYYSVFASFILSLKHYVYTVYVYCTCVQCLCIVSNIICICVVVGWYNNRPLRRGLSFGRHVVKIARHFLPSPTTSHFFYASTTPYYTNVHVVSARSMFIIRVRDLKRLLVFGFT